MKKKDKLKLIEDYITLRRILKFYQYVYERGITVSNKEELNLSLIRAIKVKGLFELIFARYGLLDISLKILMKELKDLELDKIIHKININEKFEEYVKILKNLEDNLEKFSEEKRITYNQNNIS